jgi:hypothetical protein
MIRKLALALMLVSVVACKKEEKPATPPAEATPVAPAQEPATKPASVPAEPAVDLESLSVEEDFEEEAEKDITPANLSKKVDDLEKEMSSE